MMKKLLLLLLALACMLAMVSCDEEKKVSSREEDDEEIESVEDLSAESDVQEQSSEDPTAVAVSVEEATPVVEGFLSALAALDAPGLKAYAHQSEMFEQDSFLTFEKLCNGDLGDLTSGDAAIFAGNEEQLQRLVTALLEKMSSTISYEIGESKQLGDGSASFDVTITVFDSNIGASIGQHLNDSLSQDQLMEVITELMANGTITESTTEEEMVSILLPAIMDIAIQSIETLELPTKTVSGTLVVTRIDGAVLIDLDRESTPGIFF